MKQATFHLRIFFAFLVCITPAPLLQAQNLDIALLSNFHFVDANQKSMTLKFDLMSNLIVIPLRINNSDTMRFVLDTGLRTTLISELSSRDSLSLSYARKVKIGGLGEGESLEALHSYGNFIRLNDIVGENQNIFVLFENIFHLSEKLGKQVHGLIGYDLFKSFIVEIDYIERKITFHNPKKFKYKKKHRKKYTTLPLQFEKSKPYVQVELEVSTGNFLPVKLLLDSGSSDALWLFCNSHQQISTGEKYIEGYLGRGLNGDVFGKKGRVKSLKIKDLIIKNPFASFPDSSSIFQIIEQDNRNGSIGSEIFRRFDVIFDYPNKKILLRPNHKFKSPFIYNMSGIELSTPYPELPIFIIAHIRKNSPAERAGLQVGDQVLRVNYREASDYILEDFHILFRENEGKKIKIRVFRRGKIYSHQFRLEPAF